MPLLRTQGVVLRTLDLGEHDRLVTLYTRDYGRLTAVARGAQRLRSRFGGGLELFTWGEAVGFEREGRDLVRLDQFDIRRSFRRLREDLERLGYGARMVEALLRLTPERDPHPACFALLLRALRALESTGPARVHLAFVLHLLDLLGHRPSLDRCTACGRTPETTGAVFDPAAGGLVCRGCRGPQPDRAGARAITPRALGALRGLQAARWEARLRITLPPAVQEEAVGLLDAYLAVLGGGPLRAPHFLAATRPGDRPREGLGSRAAPGRGSGGGETREMDALE